MELQRIPLWLPKATLSVIGSGWARLNSDDKGVIAIETTPNHKTARGCREERRYFGNRRFGARLLSEVQERSHDYVAAFHKVISWDAASERFTTFLFRSPNGAILA
jgi:superoxide dismutase